MSASWPDNMRGPRVKTPLLLLLLLLTSLTGTVLCQDYESEGTSAPDAAEEETSETSPTSSTSPLDTSTEPGDDTTDDEGSGNSPDTATDYTDLTISTSSPEEAVGLDPIIIMIPVVLVVVIIAIIVVCIVIKRRWNQKTGNQDLRREDPYLEDASAEKVPMPMFEEDVPSVLELEMEELDQWMKKDGETAGDSKQA